MQEGELAPDAEAPVNPYSLLEAVNSASDTVNTAWLLFIGVMSYLLITAAGVTHKDLLLNNDIPLPILQVKIDLARFFFFAPVILVLFHAGVVSQMVLLARKALEFDMAIRLLETSERRTHPLRLELDNYFFVQAIAGPERSRMMSSFLHGMVWLTVVFLPVLILLYIQVVLLPFHDVTITSAHRVALFADIILLCTIGTYLARSEQAMFHTFHRTVRTHPGTTVSTAVVLVIVALFSVFVATIPGERLDRVTDLVRGRTTPAFAQRTEAGSITGFVVPFLRPSPDGSLFGLFYRNLVVNDIDFVPDNQVQPGEASVNLRGRDLRYARLDRTDLHQADFTGADLEGASFVNADLRNVSMGCADLDSLLLREDRVAGKCTDARFANFTRARLNDARMSGIDARGATFASTVMTGVELPYSQLGGADFSSARLERADLSGGVTLYGGNFLTASLQGADLTSARLMLADFTSAQLQGAVMSHARLEGAILRDADLEGADLQSARLFNTDLSGAKITSVDLRGALVWRVPPPERDAQGLADFDQMVIRAPDELDIGSIKSLIDRVADERLKTRLDEGLAPVVNGRAGAGWGATPDAQKWREMQTASASLADGYKIKLTEALTRLACRALFANGSVAVGVGKRSLDPAFKGDLPTYYARLKGGDCASSRNVPPKFLSDLGSAADIARGQ